MRSKQLFCVINQLWWIELSNISYIRVHSDDTSHAAIHAKPVLANAKCSADVSAYSANATAATASPTAATTTATIAAATTTATDAAAATATTDTPATTTDARLENQAAVNACS